MTANKFENKRCHEFFFKKLSVDFFCYRPQFCGHLQQLHVQYQQSGAHAHQCNTLLCAIAIEMFELHIFYLFASLETQAFTLFSTFL